MKEPKPDPRFDDKDVPWCNNECPHCVVESDNSLYCELASSLTPYKTRGDICLPVVVEMAVELDCFENSLLEHQAQDEKYEKRIKELEESGIAHSARIAEQNEEIIALRTELDTQTQKLNAALDALDDAMHRLEVADKALAAAKAARTQKEKA